MNEIVTQTQTATMPSASSPILARALDVVLSGAVTTGGETILLPGKELTPESRRMAEARLSILSRSLDGRDRAKVTAAISTMLAGYPSNRQTGEEARAVLTAYVTMVDEFPPWAVVEACRRWVDTAKAEGRTLAFPPSAAELREVAERVVYRYQQERGKLLQALSARTQPISEAERTRVAAGLDRFRGELAASVDSGKRKPMTREQARAALEARCAELGVDPKAIDAVPDQPAGFRKIDFSDLPF